MPVIGFSVGDVIATAALLRRTIKALSSSRGSSTQYQRTLIELEAFIRLLRQAESLSPESSDEDVSYIESVRATAFASSLALREFMNRLEKYRQALDANQTNNVLQRSGRAVQWALDADEELSKIERYVNSQILTINTLLSMLERKNAQTRERSRQSDHSQVITELHDQEQAMRDMIKTLNPLDRTIKQHGQAVSALTQDSVKNSRLLVEMHHAIIRQPSTCGEDAITLHDALGRHFILSYVYFKHWELFQTFLRQQFADDGIPGRKQVQDGQYVVAKGSADDLALTKSNWSEQVFPGSRLSMTVILSMLKLQRGRCPRPSCDYIIPIVTAHENFVTCPRCNLTYKLDPDLELAEVPDGDQLLGERQRNEDRDAFGRRNVVPIEYPLEQEDGDSEEKAAPASDAEAKPALSALNIHRLLEEREKLSRNEARRPMSNPKFTALDVPSGTSVMDAWLQTSANPSDQLLPPLDDTQNERADLHREQKDIEQLKRVQLITTTESKPLTDAVAEYQDLPLDTQVFVRKIVDRFPDLPPYLAKRFALSNADRAKRLKGAQQPPSDHEGDGEEYASSAGPDDEND